MVSTLSQRSKTRPDGVKNRLEERLMHHDRVLGQLGVLLQRVFYFFLGRGIELPSHDVLLKQLGPRTIQIHLFARALIHNLKTVARQCAVFSLPNAAPPWLMTLASTNPSVSALASMWVTEKVSES
jgi:hypothetical protein